MCSPEVETPEHLSGIVTLRNIYEKLHHMGLVLPSKDSFSFISGPGIFLICFSLVQMVRISRLQFYFILWFLWCSKNHVLFQHEKVGPLQIIKSIEENSNRWCRVESSMTASRAKSPRIAIKRSEQCCWTEGHISSSVALVKVDGHGSPHIRGVLGVQQLHEVSGGTHIITQDHP